MSKHEYQTNHIPRVMVFLNLVGGGSVSIKQIQSELKKMVILV